MGSTLVNAETDRSMKTKFTIVIPFFNAEEWIDKCIESVLNQDVDDFTCVVADDASTDDSFDICHSLIGDDQRFKLIRNQRNLGALENIYASTLQHNPVTDPDSVVVHLDGDDWLSNSNVLSTLDRYYQSPDCWMTYGSYVNLSDGSRGAYSQKLPEEVVKNREFRKHRWCTSHLRSYRLGLFQKIQRKDLVDWLGRFYRRATDHALMFPMLEMSGEKAVFVEEVLYVYNDLNNLNVHKSSRRTQGRLARKFRRKKKYDLISGW